MMTVLSTPENKSLAGPKVGEALAEFTLGTRQVMETRSCWFKRRCVT
jgi:hypothetical protein